ncbi:MMPL family transporter [Streptomyces pseudogriseolus]|uniref:MMPL family transporter n=1 Tax=Streptomyces pseudogriseolus TaxID=36817 RepID=UPI003471D4E5
MREEHTHGKPPTEAVIRGFGQSSKAVTAAALIMIAVFGGFILADMEIIKGMGLALAVGLLVGAFIVRMTLVPAVMALLGHKAWWLPHVLQRILPAISRTARRCRKSPNTTRRKRWLCRSPGTASGTQASLRYLGGQPPQRAAACPALPQLLGSAVSSLRHHAPQREDLPFCGCPGGEAVRPAVLGETGPPAAGRPATSAAAG